MEKYEYDEKELSILEGMEIPFAVYQFVDNRVVTLALSKGYMELFDLHGHEETYRLMDEDMYRDCHPDDIAELEDAAVDFAVKDKPYNVIYRSKIKGRYVMIHARGYHFYKDGKKLALISYTDEGEYHETEDENHSIFSSVFTNIFKAKDDEKIIKYDYLTALPTISHFFYITDTSHFQKKVERNETPVMLFFDLNGMKRFNAKYGFEEGDKLIIAFSRLLAATFSNDSCCRFGMDRFCAFTSDKNLEERLWKFFGECEQLNGGKTLPVSVGIYSREIGMCGASTACDRAKMACDFSKEYYLSHFTYFDSSMLEKAEKKQYVIENIDKAINEGWIKVYYQPIVRTANGRVCDEEALARWIDPEKGFMSPADFIPALEDSKLIHKLDLFVTEEIFRKMRNQADAGLPIVPVSVNLSRADFESCDIVEEISSRVKKAGVPPENLTIEITESIIGKDYEYMKKQIKRFQSLGFKVWMDDFGSGYSSLDVLHDLQFDLIKFDMKFMRQFHDNEKTKVLLSALTRMAMNLGIDTICEGVETESQVEFLKEIGCTKLQGFYYTAPIPMEKILERYKTGKQIGFENPAESEYYTSIGKINLYDLSAVTNNDDEVISNAFNTLPMVIFECNDDGLRIVRGNKSYKEFIKKYFLSLVDTDTIEFDKLIENKGELFRSAIKKCRESDSPAILHEKLIDGTKMHVYIRKIAINPISSVTAIVAVILGVSEI